MKFKSVLKSKKPFCKKYLDFLKYIYTLTIKKRNILINKVASPNEIKALVELFFNFTHSNIKCHIKTLKSLKLYSKLFTKIIQRSTPLTIKRKLLVSKKGGFILQTILSLGIPLLLKLFGKN